MAGDQRAFAELMRKYDKRVYCLIYDLLGNTADTQDAFSRNLSSGFFGILIRFACRANSAPGFAHGNQHRNLTIFGGEKYAISGRWMQSSCRNPKRLDSAFIEQTQADRAAEESDFLAPGQSSGAQTACPQSSVFTLRHFHGYKISEIAAILPISEGTVKNALFRATQQCKKSLLPYKTQD
jgi:DNA-directed RNA polymerase specialized sigma24 family protein